MEAAWDTILGRCAANIERYSIHQHPGEPTFVPSIFRFSKFPRLEGLTITTNYLQLFSVSYPHLLREFDRLSRSRSATNLSHLRFEVHFYEALPPNRGPPLLQEVRLGWINHSFWRKLAGILSRSSFSHLEAVELQFIYSHTEGDLPEDEWSIMVDLMRSKLEDLQEDGSIRLS
jgi:hypothetical protein